MVFDWDDFGANHIISPQCQSHDCRARLYQLKEINPKFKATLFAIPGEMTEELLHWCDMNYEWIELAVHGFFHTSNYECEKISLEDFNFFMEKFEEPIDDCFKKIFRAPGWQISDDAYQWLLDNEWVVADQTYNTHRRPPALKAYLYDDASKEFMTYSPEKGAIRVRAYHGHTWDVGWNGIYEDAEVVDTLVRDTKDFKFVSEVMYES
jgi:hypothetical protein